MSPPTAQGIEGRSAWQPLNVNDLPWSCRRRSHRCHSQHLEPSHPPVDPGSSPAPVAESMVIGILRHMEHYTLKRLVKSIINCIFN